MKAAFIATIIIFAVAVGSHAKAQNSNTQGGVLRVVNGQVYNPLRSGLWKSMDGDILKFTTNGIIVSTFTNEPIYQATTTTEFRHRGFDATPGTPVLVPTKIEVGQKKVPGKSIILRNYSTNGDLAVGQTIKSFWAMLIGTTDYDGEKLELWDCGTAPTKADFTKLQATAAARRETAQKELENQRQFTAKEAAAAKSRENAKILKYQQELANKGDIYGLLRMGERYRDGNGVEKDLAKARDYLRRAADAGSPTAADELKNLP